jgi:hypothetical protein
LKKSIDTLTHDVSSHVQSLAENDSQIKLVQDQYETFKKQKDIELENFNNQLKQSSESLVAQNKQLLDKLQTLEAQYDESKKANVELQDRITELMQCDNSTQLISLNEKIVEKEK